MYGFFPLNNRFPNLPIPRFLTWGWIPSIIIGLILSILGTIIMSKVAKAAGKESYTPEKRNPMYGGIYTKIRHPQAIGDTLYYIAIAFFINSPMLVLISLLWIPSYYYISRIEEKDLVIRFGDSYKEYMQQTRMFIPKLHHK